MDFGAKADNYRLFTINFTINILVSFLICKVILPDINRFVENEIQLHEIVKSLTESVSLSTEVMYPGPPEQGEGGRGSVSPPPKKISLLMLPFLLMSPINVLFSKEVTKNVHENQKAKSLAS